MRSRAIINTIIMAILLLWTLGPILYCLKLSLSPHYLMVLDFSQFSIQHYIEILNNPDLMHSAIITFEYTFITLLILTPLSLFMGFALAKFKFRGQGLGFLCFALTFIAPIAILVPLLTYFKTMGLLNTLYAPILGCVAFFLPYGMWMMKNVIATIPVELEEAALVDGCSRLTAFLRITLPLAIRGILSVVAFLFIMTWNNYVFHFAFISDPSLSVLTKTLMSLAFGGSHGEMFYELEAALSIIMIIPAMIMFLVYLKYTEAALTYR